MSSIVARKVLAVAALPIALAVGALHPAAATVYELGNKSVGAVAPPHYGLRINDFYDGIWTFDFEHPDGGVLMEHEASGNIRIHGTVAGGRDEDDHYALGTFGFWKLDFSYTAGIYELPDGYLVDEDKDHHGGTGEGNGTLEYIGDKADGTGVIENLATTSDDETSLLDLKVYLEVFSGIKDFSFCYGEVNVAPHNINSGLCGEQNVNGEEVYKGAGWLLHSVEFGGNATHDHGDFGFTGQQVPEPSTLALLGFGIAGLGFVGRRRRV